MCQDARRCLQAKGAPIGAPLASASSMPAATSDSSVVRVLTCGTMRQDPWSSPVVGSELPVLSGHRRHMVGCRLRTIVPLPGTRLAVPSWG
ncbi:hypothetical protein NDU88_004060 [Pleurodeles waltl]|uniref:Uncharacterized protein n=1 Tax=Pleurodeles waltl TaxID=8319 RepID=A0AAV7VHQ7_PLEWA|nr:hypothetical protein NDU88_004060 [Pleurodeles waltl]